MKSLSIIIVNWNTKEYLKKCLQSIYNDDLSHSYEVIVVDNASTDGSKEMLHQLFPQVKTILNHQNLGFAQANNQAIQLSEGTYILLLNSDTIVREGAIESLVNFVENNPEVGCVGAKLLNPDNSLQFSCSPNPTLISEFMRMFHLPGIRPDGYYHMDRWKLNIPREVDVLIGACMLFRMSALEKIGSFDKQFFMYSEEVDLCYRIRQAGWKVFWSPDAEIVHYGGQSSKQVAAKMFIQLYKSKVLFFRKHRGQLAATIYKWILVTASLLRLTVLFSKKPIRQNSEHNIVSNYKRLLVELPKM